MSKDKTITERQEKIKEAFLGQLKRSATIENACQKVGVGRSTIYRWRDTNKKFKQQIEDSLEEGRQFMSDIAENQLFSLIGEKNMHAIRLYLTTHNARYGNKLELSGSLSNKDEPLTKEQKKLIKKALKLSSIKINKEKL
jgi:hypothetical protein